MHIDDAEIDQDMVYFICAYYFHWTPEQVDKIESQKLGVLLTMLPEWKKKVNDAIEGK